MSSERPTPPGLLFVVSAPSGTGKTTVVDRLVERSARLTRSRSYTSRARRPGEVEGVDYNFVSRDRFEAMIREDAFLEWADIFGNLYGTGREATELELAAGHDLVLVIDVQGARQVRHRLPGRAVEIFVLPPSFEVLAARLRGRNKDPEDAIARRLATASREVSAVEEYDYVVVNDDIDRCVSEIESIVTAERARLARRREVIAPIVSTFRQE
ncbi:MAG: guanylate kinase [Acidobacteria bacterium]|jgi:guanylate kinase|nr:guanylate kinase [Acidobacteriota bacterium]